MAIRAIEAIFKGHKMKFTDEVEKRCVLTMTKVTSPARVDLIDMLYGIPGEFHFIHKLVRNEEEARSEVETFKLKNGGGK
jgi:hypothetical protein